MRKKATSFSFFLSFFLSFACSLIRIRQSAKAVKKPTHSHTHTNMCGYRQYSTVHTLYAEYKAMGAQQRARLEIDR